MRLLVLGIQWPPETFLANMLRGLAAENFHITIASNQCDRTDQTFGWIQLPSSSQSRLLRLASLARSTVAAAARSFSQVRTVLRASRQTDGLSSRFELLNRVIPCVGRHWDAIYFPWNEGAIAAFPIFELGIPVVISCRGTHISIAPTNPDRGHLVQGLRESFAKSSAIHCVSNAIQNEAVLWGLDPAKSHVIRPAVDTSFFSAATSKPRSNRLRIITTGRLTWVKGLEYSLAAVAQLRERGVDFQYEIIGDGHERERIVYAIHDLDLSDRVTLRGNLQPEEVKNALGSADVFVLPSLSEGIANVVLEAMAMGLPVVTSDCGGMKEAVTDGEEGFVVPVRDPERLTEALIKLARDPSLRATMGLKGRRRIENDFTLARQISKWRDLFESLAATAESPIQTVRGQVEADARPTFAG